MFRVCIATGVHWVPPIIHQCLIRWMRAVHHQHLWPQRFNLLPCHGLATMSLHRDQSLMRVHLACPPPTLNHRHSFPSCSSRATNPSTFQRTSPTIIEAIQSTLPRKWHPSIGMCMHIVNYHFSYFLANWFSHSFPLYYRRAIIWVERPLLIWLMQSLIATMCFIEALLQVYLSNKVRIPGSGLDWENNSRNQFSVCDLYRETVCKPCFRSTFNLNCL